MAAVSAPVLCVPLVGSVPLQAPEATQDCALADVQLKVEAPPAGTAGGAAANCAVGSGLTVIVTLAAWLVPPGPLHANE